MVELLKILAVALVTVFATMLVKQTKPEIAILISIVGSIIIIIMAVNVLNSVITSFYKIFQTTGVETTLRKFLNAFVSQPLMNGGMLFRTLPTIGNRLF